MKKSYKPPKVLEIFLKNQVLLHHAECPKFPSRGPLAIPFCSASRRPKVSEEIFMAPIFLRKIGGKRTKTTRTTYCTGNTSSACGFAPWSVLVSWTTWWCGSTKLKNHLQLYLDLAVTRDHHEYCSTLLVGDPYNHWHLLLRRGTSNHNEPKHWS